MLVSRSLDTLKRELQRRMLPADKTRRTIPLAQATRNLGYKGGVYCGTQTRFVMFFAPYAN